MANIQGPFSSGPDDPELGLSPQQLQAANPGGVPLGVSMPGDSNAFVVPGSNNFGISGSTLGQGIQGTIISIPNGAAAVPSTAFADPSAASNPTSITVNKAPGPAAGSLADYFARAIIIVLGFIFVAIGLNMLRPGTVPIPRVMGR